MGAATHIVKSIEIVRGMDGKLVVLKAGVESIDVGRTGKRYVFVVITHSVSGTIVMDIEQISDFRTPFQTDFWVKIPSSKLNNAKDFTHCLNTRAETHVPPGVLLSSLLLPPKSS